MYEKFEKLLAAKGVTPYRVHKDTGISSATLSDWKNGKSEPKKDKIEKICKYFDVPLSYFYGDDDEKESGEKYYLNDETAKAAQEIFENKELRALFDVARNADPEDLKALHSMALALRRKERGDQDDTGC
ncbi:MAG TPA: helix-turn-helix transcriptional regulator [Candidatus Merdisoma merdipullorum]|nr:helix-turn-helix transcriptional regulator [Candidatus Merdisoma merdipullorum]